MEEIIEETYSVREIRKQVYINSVAIGTLSN